MMGVNLSCLLKNMAYSWILLGSVSLLYLAHYLYVAFSTVKKVMGVSKLFGLLGMDDCFNCLLQGIYISQSHYNKE